MKIDPETEISKIIDAIVTFLHFFEFLVDIKVSQ